MADELSDFFAKKDKKKGKKTKGFTTSQKVTERVESQVQSQAEREKSEGSLAPERPFRRTKEDEDWKDFAEEAQRDLSGLRIQSLQRRGDGEEGKQDGEQDGEEGENGKGEKGAIGPWLVEDSQSRPSSGPSSVSDEPEPQPVASAAEPTTQEQTTSSSGRYVPPSLRGDRSGAGPVSGYSAPPPSSGSSGKYVPPSVRAAQERAAAEAASAPAGGRPWPGRGGPRNVVPDVSSQQSFPSLQDSAGYGQRAPARGGFEEVRRGAPSGAPRSRGPELQLGNKYNPLNN